MFSVVDCIFIGAGCVFGGFIVMAIVLIRISFRDVAHKTESRQEPALDRPQMQTYTEHSPWDTSASYEGFTGVIHVHGVKTGDTFRAVITDNNSKCKLEKLIRVRA